MNTWLITDLHFNHIEKMMEYCGRPHNYTSKLLDGLFEIPKDDLLICLGDITIGHDLSVHDCIIKELKCRKVLTLGNHDTKSIHWYMTHGWDFACYQFKWKNIVFSHFPIPVDTKILNIHGHFHNSGHRNDDFPFITQNNVCLVMEGTNYKPVKLDKFLHSVNVKLVDL